MAQFRPPGENPWHQFLTQGMPQITRLVEGAREEKRIETQQAREDTLSIVNTLINVSGKYTAAGDYKASSNALKNASNIVSKSPHLKDLNLEFIINASDNSNEYLQTRDNQDADIINEVLSGDRTALDARKDPNFSKEGRGKLDKLQGSGAITEYQMQGVNTKLDLVTALTTNLARIRAIDKRFGGKENRIKVKNAETALIKAMDEIVNITLLGKKYGKPIKILDTEVPADYPNWTKERQEQWVLDLASQIGAGAETETAEEIEARLQREKEQQEREDAEPPTIGLKATPINGNVNIEYTGLDGKIVKGSVSKQHYDIALQGGWKAKASAYRNIANKLKGVSSAEVQAFFEAKRAKGETKITEPASKSAQDLIDEAY